MWPVACELRSRIDKEMTTSVDRDLHLDIRFRLNERFQVASFAVDFVSVKWQQLWFAFRYDRSWDMEDLVRCTKWKIC